MTPTEAALSLTEGRFARFEAIEWWDQSRLRDARILLIGAGALGNEVLKNFALLGVGHVVVVDMDRIELSNLSRSVLFRESDAGEPKAATAARAATAIYPDARIVPITGNVLGDVGLGWFCWAQVVIAALDNREARVFVNSACAKVGRPWIDGGLEALQGIVRVFAPPATACYECTMGRVDWEQLNQRRSCSLLARRAAESRGTPTTPVTASVIGALQTQEAVKLLHDLEGLRGRGMMFDGANATTWQVEYPINPDCEWHEAPARIERATDLSSDAPLRTVFERGRAMLGGIDSLDFSREVVERVSCPSCGSTRDVYAPLDQVAQTDALCASCGAECVPHLVHSASQGDASLDRSIRDAGLPTWDIFWARHGDDMIGIEIAGDRLPRGNP